MATGNFIFPGGTMARVIPELIDALPDGYSEAELADRIEKLIDGHNRLVTFFEGIVVRKPATQPIGKSAAYRGMTVNSAIDYDDDEEKVAIGTVVDDPINPNMVRVKDKRGWVGVLKKNLDK